MTNSRGKSEQPAKSEITNGRDGASANTWQQVLKEDLILKETLMDQEIQKSSTPIGHTEPDMTPDLPPVIPQQPR